jgi:small subunit ribosomal protein S6
LLTQYETTFIVDAHLPDEQIDKILEKMTKLIDGGGKVVFVDRWGKRRLAYEIKKKQYGYYVYVRFEAEGTFIKELEREFKLDDAILRYLIVLVPRIVLTGETERKAKLNQLEKEEDPQSADETEEDFHEESEIGSPETEVDERIDNG